MDQFIVLAVVAFICYVVVVLPIAWAALILYGIANGIVFLFRMGLYREISTLQESEYERVATIRRLEQKIAVLQRQQIESALAHQAQLDRAKFNGANTNIFKGFTLAGSAPVVAPVPVVTRPPPPSIRHHTAAAPSAPSGSGNASKRPPLPRRRDPQQAVH